VAALALVCVFAISLVLGAALHLDLPVARRLVARRVNAALAELPSGKAHVEGIERLTLSRVAVRVFEIELAGVGRARAERVSIRFDVRPTLWALIRERNTIALHVSDVAVDLADVALSPGPEPAAHEVETGPPRAPLAVKVDVDELRLHHAYVGGNLPSGDLVDADLDGVRSSGSIDSKRVRGSVTAKVTARTVLPLPLEVDLDAVASIPLGTSGGTRSVSAGVVARAGEARLEAHGDVEGNSIELEVLVPDTPPEVVRTLWAAAPFTRPVSLRGRAGGTLPRLDARIDLALGGASAEADALIDLDRGPGAEFTVAARDVDLRAFGEGLPASRLAFEADGRVRRIDARKGELPLEGEATVSTLSGSIEGESIPRTDARVRIDRTLHLTANVNEPGAPARVEVAQIGSNRFRGWLEATAPSLADVPRLSKRGIAAIGRAVLRAEASLDDGVLASRATVDVYRAGFSKVAVGAGRVEARAEGPLEKLRIWASAHLIALRSEPYAVNDLLVDAAGGVDSFDFALVGRGGTFDALALDAQIDRTTVANARNVSARIERGGEVVAIAARRLSFGRDLAEVEGLAVEGLGDRIEATASRSRGTLTASIRAPAFDLDRLAIILGIAPEHLGGKGSMSVTLAVEKGHDLADAHVRLTGGRFRSVPPLDVALDLGLDGTSVHGLFSARNRELGGVHLEATGALSGSLFDPRSLGGSTGRLVFSTDRISLARVCAVVPCSATVKQIGTSMRATLQAHAVVERGEGATGGDTDVHLDLQANDNIGRVGHVSLDSRFDLRGLLTTGRIPSDAPVEADFGIERRELEALPANVRPTGLTGQADAHGYAQGTIGAPFFVIEVAGYGLKYSARAPNAPSLDLEWVTTYDLEQAASEVTVRSASRQVMHASVQATASLEKLLAGENRWTGGAYAELDRFPLAFLPTDEQRVTGDLSGKISIFGLHEKPGVKARLHADDFRVGREAVGSVELALTVDERSCAATIDAGSAGAANAARATLKGNAACFWKDATIPAIDPNGRAELALDASHFSLGALAPAVDTWVERLHGKLDAHLLATADPLGNAGKWVVAGEAHVREGNMLPLSIGRELKQLDLDLKADTKGAIRVERVAGEIGAGRFTGVASVDVSNLEIRGGHAEFHVPKRQSIPMTIEGVSYGTVWGDVYADGQLTQGDLLVNVRAPTLRIDLPPQRTAQLENLKDDPAILVLQPLGPPEHEKAVGGGPIAGPERPRRIVVSFELGNNVGISREDMKIELTTVEPPGNPKLIFDPEPRLEGAIRILGGTVPVAGRVFRVERGTVTFSGDDPANPALDVNAIYEGADASATRINVHVGGTAKDVKLALTSSPPKSQNELLAILAFGEPAPSGGLAPTAPQAAGATAAAGVAAAGVGSAILTTGVNQLLSQSVIPIRTSLSTGASTLASASIELTERVRVQYIRLITTTLYGQPQDVNQFALDWRFKPRWLLRTVVGDRGTTTLDILWNRWY
jgi:translocation and assembly module TamB